MDVTRKIVLANGKEFNLADNVAQIDFTYKGLLTGGLSITMSNADPDEVSTAFADKTATATMQEVDTETAEVYNTYEGFTDMYSTAIDYDRNLYTVLLAKSVNYQEDIKNLTDAQAATAKEVAEVKVQVEDLTTEPDPTKMELADAIEYLSNDSKNQLSTYLETHPITSTVHGTEARYSITKDKQNMLTSMILMTQMAKQNGLEYTPSWNATNEPCTYDWTVEQLQALAVQIEATVRPLISLQQTIESNIRKAKTVEDAIAANVKFEDAVATKLH